MIYTSLILTPLANRSTIAGTKNGPGAALTARDLATSLEER